MSGRIDSPPTVILAALEIRGQVTILALERASAERGVRGASHAEVQAVEWSLDANSGHRFSTADPAIRGVAPRRGARAGDNVAHGGQPANRRVRVSPLYEICDRGTTALTDPLAHLPRCSNCGEPAEPFGNWKRTFRLHESPEDLICTACAKVLAPDEYALALEWEKRTGPFDPDKGL